MIKKLLFLLVAVTCSTFTVNAQNLLLNGSLEAGSGDVFTNWTKANGSANLTAETVQIHGGLRGLKAISTGANEYNVQLQSDAVTTIVGTSYEITFWVKSVTGGSTIRLSTATGAAMYQPAQTIGTTWQQVTWGFTANTEKPMIVSIAHMRFWQSLFHPTRIYKYVKDIVQKVKGYEERQKKQIVENLIKNL